MRGTIRRRGPKFQAIGDFRDPITGTRVRPARTFASRKQAAEWLTEQQYRVTQGLFTDPSKTTLATYLSRWLEGLKLDVRPSTWSWYETTVRNHIIPGLGLTRLNTLTVDTVKAFYAKLPAHTARRVHTTLRRALASAEVSGLMTRNPAALVKKPRSQMAGPPVWWNPQEPAAFLTSARPDPLYAAWRTIAMTGLRRGEALGLFWSDIDWEQSTLTVRRSLGVKPARFGSDQLHDAIPTLSEPKTGSSYRTVDLDPETLATLKEHRKRQMEAQLAAGAAWFPSELVFTDVDGTPVDPRNLSKAFRNLVRQSGLRKIKLHELRDTHGSQLIIAGVHPKVVQERLGHSSMTVTLGLYAHVMPSMGKDAAEKAASLLNLS